MKYITTFICLTIPGFALSADDLTTLQPLVQTHCVGCHSPAKQKGDLRLDDLLSLEASRWQDVYDRIASREMPPDDAPQPTKSHRDLLLQHTLSLAVQGSEITSPGLRRLNKREYGNTIRALLGLENGTFDPSEYIYDDEIDEGFDTAAESLVISNELLLEYLSAAEKSLRHALFTSESTKPPSRVVAVKPKRMKGTSGRYINNHADYVICRSGGKAQLYDGEATRTMTYPGRYTITVTAAGVDRERYPIRFQPANGPIKMGFGIAQDASASVSSKPQLLKSFELKDEVDQTFTFDTWIDADHYPYLSFINGSGKPITQIRSNVRRRKIPASAMNKAYVGPGVRVSQFKIEGPFYDEWPPQSIRKTYDSDVIPDLANQSTREQAVLRFAKRAFRRNVTLEELTPWLEYLNSQHAAGGDWHEAVIKTFTAMLGSIDFLYLREGQGELDAYALANRLSYFFWSTMPDAELFHLAKTGELTQPKVLREQVTRLLSDERSTRFSHSFADQWLSLNTLGSMPPDIKNPQYKDYYRDNLEQAMLEETRSFFTHVLQNNVSVQDFIDADYSFINKSLAKLYDVPFEGGNGFTRVTFKPNSKRGGLLGHASVLTLSANGVETSPVERGVWVLADFLGTPPPPPPKEVPAITPDLNGALTVRDLLEKHRSDPACMECHRRMDPLGFALEAYDPIGRFRTKYSPKQQVSTEGNYMGKDFENVDQLKKILAADIRPFARNLTIRITEYAKGRKLVAADYATIESIVDKTEQDGFKLKDIIMQIATSELMTNR